MAGNVSSADSLLSGGSATLQYAAGGQIPSITVDYGRDVGGLPYFDIAGQSGSPTLLGAFSESLPSAQSGDIGAGLTVSADPQRGTPFAVTSVGMLKGVAVQGGERYETLSLSTPGSVTISSLGVDSLYSAPTLRALGTFASSSNALNSIWNAGAYTVDLDRLAPNALPLTWVPSADGMTVDSSGAGIVQKSGTWPSDYTMSFEVRVNRNSAGWTMRNTNNLTGLRFVLHGANGSVTLLNR